MKNIIYILPIVALIALMASCEEKMDTWSGADRLNFKSKAPVDTIMHYSFVSRPQTVTRDTFWIEIVTQGKISDYPRPVKLKVVKPHEGIQAQPGVHYIEFDQMGDDLKAKYVIAAGANSGKLPVVLLRDESLKQNAVSLRVVFEENEYFQYGFAGYWSHRTIIFSDKPVKPKTWDTKQIFPYFGTYGPVKHRFIIDMTGFAFDDAWIAHEGHGLANDPDYMRYLSGLLQGKLDKENARRKEENGGVDDPLTEDDGTIVSFIMD